MILFVVRGGAEGGTAQNTKEKNGEGREKWLTCVIVIGSSWCAEKAFSRKGDQGWMFFWASNTD